jgi:cell division protein FtsQ
VDIESAQQQVFVDEKEVLVFLNKMGVKKGIEIKHIDARVLEDEFKQNQWIKEIELFFDNNQVLHVEIEEREPIARVFTANNISFYIDSNGIRLPLKNEIAARLPVFTSITGNRKKPADVDSLLITDIKKIAKYIKNDSFWTAQISQIDITPKRTFEIIPVLGNQVIVIGNTDSLEQKFNRLYSFYRQVWAKTGFEKYEKIDVQFNGQVIATRRGTVKPHVDSLKAMRRFTNTLAKINTIVKDTLMATPEDRAFISGKKDTIVPGKQKGINKAAVEKQESEQVLQQPKAVMKRKVK